MFTSLEQLAQQLVESGLLRIDADEKRNFVQLPTADEDLFFSHRELFDPKLLPATKAQLSDISFNLLRKKFKTIMPIAADIEQKIARLIVQAAHPAIIKLALLERAEFFVSFSYNVSDLMEIAEYQSYYGTGGLQAFDMRRARIYISSAGDPFANHPDLQTQANNAIARFLIIGAQEIAHFSDLERNKSGQIIGRFSARKTYLKARRDDIAWLVEISKKLYKLNLKNAAKVEQSVSFYAKYRKNSLKHRLTILHSFLLNRILRFRALKAGIPIAKLHSVRWLAVLLADMKFNLDPQGYEHTNRMLEELTKSAEALARVPQQELKWGRKTVKFLYPNLHRLYYSEVIPSVISTLETKSGKKFVMLYKKQNWFSRPFRRKNK